MTYSGHKINRYFEYDWEEFSQRYNKIDPVTASIVWAMAHPIGALEVPTQVWHNAERMIELKIEQGCPVYRLGGDLYEAYRMEYLVNNGILIIPEEKDETPQETSGQEVIKGDGLLSLEELEALIQAIGKKYMRNGHEYTGIEHIDVVLRMWDEK